MCLLLFTSESSPLYWLNSWVDANAYFTVGKGAAHGLVPYRDLFEQKGPLLYFLHTLAYWVSHRTFFGVYLAEAISLGVTLWLAQRTLRLFMRPLWADCLTFLMPVFLMWMPYFREGDSAEEFAFPFIMSLLYVLFWAGHTQQWPIRRMLVLEGISFAAVIWIKYSLVGSWIGFYLVLGCAMLFKREWLQLGKTILDSLAGMLIVTLPILLYFGLNHALHSLFGVYFKFNMTIYANSTSLVGRLSESLQLFWNSFLLQPVFGVLMGLAVLAILLTRFVFPTAYGKWLFSMAFLCCGLLAFYGGKAFDYYHLILFPYAIAGLIVLGIGLEKLPPVSQWGSWVLWLVSLILAVVWLGNVNQNYQESKLFPHNSSISAAPAQPLKPAQLVFAQYLKQYPHATLLNYDQLDLGLYTTADILPTTRYFENQNVPVKRYPAIMRTQNRLVRDRKVDFVVTRTYGNPVAVDYPLVAKNYEVVQAHAQYNQDVHYIYWLLKKK
ncbi:teichoic acid polysaccharide glycosyl transferase [Lactobacillus selangorensis]|uniref:Teichoic acid polysaccharide glycosyl transferase n=1 Tax=Lactobacillus selangorensis TaxID=81857 RepID=A0A0R2FZ45_9LACO|nr:teichoic acid polysaccharide glycosyl transferase [Lactobacillus selangorensis]